MFIKFFYIIELFFILTELLYIKLFDIIECDITKLTFMANIQAQ